MQAMAKSKGGTGQKPKAKARKTQATGKETVQLKRSQPAEKPAAKKGKPVKKVQWEPSSEEVAEDSSDGMGDMDDEFGSDVDLDTGADNMLDAGVSSEEGSDDEDDAEVCHCTISASTVDLLTGPSFIAAAM